MNSVLKLAESVPPRLRLLFLGKFLFNLGWKELANMRINDFYLMVGSRLKGDLRREVSQYINDRYLKDSDENPYIISSRNYQGAYPVSRVSVWRWLKGLEVYGKLVGAFLRKTQATELKKGLHGPTVVISVVREAFLTVWGFADSVVGGVSPPKLALT